MDKIICVGKNYMEHALEMAKASGDAVPESPVLFLKPPSTLVYGQAAQALEIALPEGRGSIHHECEIVCRVRKVAGVPASIDAVTLGLDMTLRDVQAHLKKASQPWEISKVFQSSAIIGPWIELASFREYLDTEFSFSCDGVIRQAGKGSQMRTSPQECLEHAERCFPIHDGDLLFTGTPAGVGPVTPGMKSKLTWANRLSYEVFWR